MSIEERVRACYLHSCLCYVTRKQMTNSTLRERFGISAKNSADASRLLKEAINAGLIVNKDPNAGARNRNYLPFWAG
jgi:ATP-dependent DNA helicase RecG